MWSLVRTKTSSPYERVLAQLRVGGPDECWEWTGATVAFGYGKFKWGGRKGSWYTPHRVMFEHHFGPLPADKPNVLHSCDNPPCCNPAHLFAGTHGDNIRDALRKGRMSHSGPKNGNAVLTEAEVEMIRAICRGTAANNREIGRVFRVSHETVRAIRHGIAWSCRP